jgi:hypothetical protein
MLGVQLCMVGFLLLFLVPGFELRDSFVLARCFTT